MSELKRIVVVGVSGSGKTTVAKALGETLELPHLELDAVMHDGGWNATSDDEFRRRIDDFTRGERWVVDGNYTSHGAAEIVWPRADTFVWIDPSKPVVMWRVVSRTLRRMVTRERMWGGLTEPISNLYRLDPYQNIIVWAWTQSSPQERSSRPRQRTARGITPTSIGSAPGARSPTSWAPPSSSRVTLPPHGIFLAPLCRHEQSATRPVHRRPW